ncbi:MAG: TonB-dependent receptor [Paludibacter sp.]|nr:TonB-dependent receptor [Paludibacter sp.]
MKKIFSLILLCSLAFPLFASESIKGSVVDAGDQSPLDFVNVTVFKQGSNKPVTFVSTDTNGAFVIPTLENGKYTVRLSYVGFTTVNQAIEVNNQQVNLGVIKMDADSKNLKEVEVVGQGSQMHFDIDKKVFSVDQNIAAAGGSASDVLKNIPSVTVDNQGNVSLRKDGNVEVWINGKASGLTVDNRAQVLQQMPAESIESIEVMTNPSAKFNPEGSAGIINIVMKEKHKAGYFGSVSAGIMYPDGGKIGQNLGASLNYSSSKVDAYVNLGYRAMSFKGGSRTDRTNFAPSDSIAQNKNTSVLNQNNVNSMAFSGLFMRAGVDYHLDAKNTLSLSGFGMAGSGNQNSAITNTTTNVVTNDKSIFTQQNTGSGTRPSLNLNMDYRHDFDKKGSNLMANLAYSNHNRTGNSDYLQTDTIVRSNLNQVTDDKNKELELKVDYTNKLTENSKLEAGFQSSLENRLSTSSGIDNATRINLPGYFDSFDYNEQINAAYVTYGSRYKNLTFQLGLRAEYYTKQFTDNTMDSTGINNPAQHFKADPIFHVFPSFYLSYTMANKDELQFNYSNRVNRPRGRQINPYKNYSDPINISFGNPYLLPQYSSSLELNYIKSWDANTLSASLYYHNTDNVIEGVRYVKNINVVNPTPNSVQVVNSSIMENTFLNIAKSQSTGLELIAKNRLFKILSLTTTLNGYYSKLDPATYLNPNITEAQTPITIPGQSSFSWSGNIMANFMLSKTFSGQITGEYESAQLIAQGRENAKYSLDMGIRQTFFDRKFSVSLNVRDLLNSDRDNSTTSGSGFTQNTSSYFHGRMFGVTLSYNFGNMKPKPGELKKKEGGGDMNMEGGE